MTTTDKCSKYRFFVFCCQKHSLNFENDVFLENIKSKILMIHLSKFHFEFIRKKSKYNFFIFFEIKN